ncbi:ExeM/NucH family extracellular endonuclease [Paraglaciecola chathamensis]|jgi:predicted extracellular nuclease/endonuclease I|uniref:Endonuclease I n=1 Tax=Paraglaciecola agarilytica NO2 TaxID=1125747 RepID=A0ABQ0I8Y6_9ALTE|nr:ExeM/NucH family extracellular endonuclease [Paraglaciecola agarilytica]GAC05786.1 endonuclease I [Paraglaciecola agarilytica NO2]
MKLKYPALLALLSASAAQAGELVITGVFDGPLTGGVPKGIELFVTQDIADLSTCGVGSANNGGGSDNQEFTFPARAATAGTYIYLASESPQFNAFFGFEPTYTDSAANINGDDAIELFCDGVVVDVFGDINVDGSGQPWEYMDGWAYRNADTGPDGSTFAIGNWTFSGANALDGDGSNAASTTPFPLKSFAEEVDGGDTGGGSGGETDPASPCFNCPELEPIADASTFDSESYYAAVTAEVNANSSAATIKNAITNTISQGHKNLSYAEVWTALTHTDEDPNNTDNVILWYKGTSIAKSSNGSGTQNSDPDNWNREHSWAKSHGFPNESQEAYTDIHHLRPTDISVNSSRGNLDFDNSDNALAEAPSNRVDGDSFEPRDAVKGDVARMMFYMDTRYEGLGDSTPDLVLVDRLTATGDAELGRLCRLVEWHYADPVDAAEQLRNDTIYEYQGNRNPYIDHPEWVDTLYQTPACDSDDGDTGGDTGGDSGGSATAGDIVISGVIDGPLSGGTPKAIEFFVRNDIADLSTCGFGSANNGGGSDGQEYTFSGSAAAGDFIYIASEGSNFDAYFGFSPTDTAGAASINGDDAIELFCDGEVVDVFGDINTDGTGEPWDHVDGWAYRVASTGPDGSTFTLSNWVFSGANALDGEATNATAASQFPIGSYTSKEVLLISGVFDGPLSGGTPKAIEFYAVTDIQDLSVFGFGSANNGGGTDGQEYAFSGSASAGEYFYVATEKPGFNAYFGFDPTFTSGAAGINGDDAIELFHDGEVVDVFGDINVDGTGQPWDYLDGWAYRVADSGPDGSTFVLANWTFSGTNVLDGSSDNATVSTPFPLGSFDGSGNNGGGDNGGDETPLLGMCAEPATLISAIQGTTDISPVVGETHIIEGVVTASFPNLSGYFVQEEDGDQDGDSATSEGIFVYSPSLALPEVGSLVRVLGDVAEAFNKTQLVVAEINPACGTGAVTATPLTLPFESVDAMEALEGMLVSSSSDLTVTDTFSLGRYGEVLLSNGRRFVPTNLFAAGSPEAVALAAENELNQITLDDGVNGQNPEVVVYPAGGLSASNPLRSGDTVAALTGVMDFSFSLYRIIPVEQPTIVASNPRTDAPDLDLGNLKVASLNVLNYFNTLDVSPNLCGPSNLECRGADSEEEFERQRAKTLAALLAMDADIVGLMEVENNGFGTSSAVGDLVSGLNDVLGANTYAVVDAGSAIGTDAITVALIYKPAVVSAIGDPAILDSSNSISDDDGPLFLDTKNRPALNQKFALTENNEELVISVNHFKSKGSSCGAGDDDTTTGQGNCNLTRTRAAQALTTFLSEQFAETPKLIIGDLNAYALEEPILKILEQGYTNLANKFGGDEAYSYSFGGEFGYLDHALASAELVDKVVDTTEWHINADEPIVFDYNVEFKSEQQQIDYYAPDAYRMSDHDPVVISLLLESEVQVVEGDYDGDGDVDKFDIQALNADIRSGVASDMAFDFNGDGKLTIRDVLLMYRKCTRSRCAAN